MVDFFVIDENGEEITDERTEEEWLAEILGAALKSIKLDEIDQEIERLILEGKQVAYYSDTVH